MNSSTNNEFANPEDAIIIYQPPEGNITLEVQFFEETVWLSQQQMAQLFGTTKQNISLHINNIFREGELQSEVVVKDSLTTTQHGAIENKTQTKKIKLYNLDVIISVGYRVKSIVGTRFRQWANQIIKQYLLKGYSYNSHLVALQQQIDNRFCILENKVNAQEEKIDFLIQTHQLPTENLFNNGCVWDAYSFFASLIRSAKERVVLIDNYCDSKTLTLLDNRRDNVIATIHTTYNRIIEDALTEHNLQYREIKRVQLPHKIHDRFLIIDNDVYLLGNSLKDMGHTLSSAILTGFTPEEVLDKLE